MQKINDKALREYYMRSTDYLSCFERDVSSITELLLFEPNEHLIQEGAPSRYLFFLVVGRIKYYTMSDNGKIIPLGGSKGFRVLGEVASLWGRAPSAGVMAVDESYCLAINLSQYRDRLFKDNRFLCYICRLLAEKVMLLDNNIAAFVSRPLEDRLAAYILQNSTGDVFNDTLVDCGEAVASSYRHLLRIMDSFCRRGLMKKDGRRYRIVDRRGLAALSSEAYEYFD